MVLLDGDWYELTKTYRDYVNRIVNEAFYRGAPWDLPPWSAAPGSDEKSYNSYVGSACHGFLCLDRKLVYTRMHKRGFEACDLLGPNQELIHVKRVSSRTGSAPLSHLFAQGIVSTESLTDQSTWQKFVSLVREQDSGQADQLGSRPSAVVYAIHRSDGPLVPDRLFTFAQSELASASMIFDRLGIPLQICVIS
jgi:uncharacterized protein (TIGR04141 family)